jgi:hypothetical protein
MRSGRFHWTMRLQSHQSVVENLFFKTLHMHLVRVPYSQMMEGRGNGDIVATVRCGPVRVRDSVCMKTDGGDIVSHGPGSVVRGAPVGVHLVHHLLGKMESLFSNCCCLPIAKSVIHLKTGGNGFKAMCDLAPEYFTASHNMLAPRCSTLNVRTCPALYGIFSRAHNATAMALNTLARMFLCRTTDYHIGTMGCTVQYRSWCSDIQQASITNITRNSTGGPDDCLTGLLPGASNPGRHVPVCRLSTDRQLSSMSATFRTS